MTGKLQHKTALITWWRRSRGTWSRDTRAIAECFVVLWDVATRKKMHTLEIGASFSPDGTCWRLGPRSMVLLWRSFSK